MEFVITSNQIVGFCSFIIGIWGVWKIVREVKKPHNDLRETVDKHAEYIANDHKRLEEMGESNKMILQCLLVIMDHNITGNGIDNMKGVRKEIQEYLINK